VHDIFLQKKKKKEKKSINKYEIRFRLTFANALRNQSRETGFGKPKSLMRGTIGTRISGCTKSKSTTGGALATA
jgi:hypothetical protein